MGQDKKALFPCKKCQKNITISRIELEESIKSSGDFKCPHCEAIITRTADVYTKMLTAE